MANRHKSIPHGSSGHRGPSLYQADVMPHPHTSGKTTTKHGPRAPSLQQADAKPRPLALTRKTALKHDTASPVARGYCHAKATRTYPKTKTFYSPGEGYWTPHGTWDTPHGEFSCPEEANGEIHVNGAWWSVGDGPPNKRQAQNPAK